MRAIISGEDVGTTIEFRGQGAHQAQHPWPETTIVSAGKGLVFRRGTRESYRTLFIEVYPPGASIIRGEGETFEACENAAWTKYQNALSCPASEDGSHQWVPRGHKNGAGFCAHCNTFKSKAFTGQDLGQFCDTCGVGTTYHWDTNAAGEEIFLCEEHTPEPDPDEDDIDVLSRFFG